MAARSHGISEPIVEASARTVQAKIPPDNLVGAMLHRLKREAEQRELDQLASFLATLDPDQIALLRHLSGIDIVDEGALRRLDPQGDLINEQAIRPGFTVRTRWTIANVPSSAWKAAVWQPEHAATAVRRRPRSFVPSANFGGRLEVGELDVTTRQGPASSALRVVSRAAAAAG